MPKGKGKKGKAEPEFAHVGRGLKYARDVVAGRVPACRWIVLACQRHLEDLERSKDADWPFRFDKAKAERVCRFIEKLPHTKGPWAKRREKLRLEPWQSFMTTVLFGWVKKADGLRRFTKALLLVPRKNAKSAWAAAVGIYMLVADGEFGAEVYSGATSLRQALEIFGPARIMVSRTPALQQRFGIGVNAKSLHVLATESRFEPVVGKPGDGASPSCAIHDEYHEHQTNEQVDTMETGMLAREQPLQLIVTTAGDNLGGPCFAAQQEAERMLTGVLPNEQLFALIYTVDPDDDWTSEIALRKANPNFGVSIMPEILIGKQRDAVNNPRRAGTFKTKHLNIWVQARDAYFPIQRWLESAEPDLRLEQFLGQPVRIGVDLASHLDIAAVELLFAYGPDRWARFGRYYLPEATIHAGENEHYRGWVDQGWITQTEGDYIDYIRIRDELLADVDRFQVEKIAFDPAQARMMITELEAEGVPCVEVRPTTVNFSEPMKWVQSRVMAREIRHNADPVMSWQMANVVARPNAKDEVYPRKDRPENKIDSPVALIMARATMMQPEKPKVVSVYELEAAEERRKIAASQPAPVADQHEHAAPAQPVARPAQDEDGVIDYEVLQDVAHPMFAEMKRRWEKQRSLEGDDD